MNAEGKPEMGDVLVLKDRNALGQVIKIKDHWFTADEYTVRYPDGSTEVVTGHLIQAVRAKPRNDNWKKQKKRKNDRGFSLVSVMIALILLSFGLLALVRVSAHTIGVRHGTSARAVATYIAGAHLEEVKMWDDSLIVSESGIAIDREGVPDAAGSYIRNRAIDRTALPNMIKATVTVEYPWASGRRRSINLVTFFREPS